MSNEPIFSVLTGKSCPEGCSSCYPEGESGPWIYEYQQNDPTICPNQYRPWSPGNLASCISYMMAAVGGAMTESQASDYCTRCRNYCDSA